MHSTIFIWHNVTLSDRNNTVQTIGTLNGNTYIDSTVWTLNPNVRIKVGARLPITDSGNRFFDMDTYYSSCSTGSTTHTIANTTDQTEYQTYRSGSFSYTIPAQNGAYLLFLKFMEPTKTSTGARLQCERARPDNP